MSGEPVRCPRCGAQIGAADELCPACLFRAGLVDGIDMAASRAETRLSPAGDSTAAPSTSGALPAAIGPYRIVSLLGEGGMGVVYKAEQAAPLRRRVALKVIKLGMDTREVVARFEAERQALALMEYCVGA